MAGAGTHSWLADSAHLTMASNERFVPLPFAKRYDCYCNFIFWEALAPSTDEVLAFEIKNPCVEWKVIRVLVFFCYDVKFHQQYLPNGISFIEW